MLTDPEIKRAVTSGHFLSDAGQPIMQKLDGDNLWLELMESGKACWRFRYIKPLNAKPTRMGVGIYPFTGLSEARSKANEARRLLAAGRDPIAERQQQKDAAKAKRTFKEVIEEWFAAFRESNLSLSSSTRSCDLRTRDQLTELFGKQLMGSIDAGEISSALIQVATVEGHNAKARQLRAMLREVFSYAITKKDCTSNPAMYVKLPKLKVTALAAIIRPSEVGKLMQDIASYDGRVFTRAALEVMAHTVPRPANIAAMRWDEIEGNIWTIPAGKMKMRKVHRVPLSTQVLAILAELRRLTTSEYVFSTNNRPMGAKTLNRALRAMGYGDQHHSAHGFRSTFSTLLNAECRWPKDIVELQLAHGDEDKVAGIYNRVHELDALMGKESDITDRLWQVRSMMMQHWSNRLDELRSKAAPGNVVPMKLAA